MKFLKKLFAANTTHSAKDGAEIVLNAVRNRPINMADISLAVSRLDHEQGMAVGLSAPFDSTYSKLVVVSSDFGAIHTFKDQDCQLACLIVKDRAYDVRIDTGVDNPICQIKDIDTEYFMESGTLGQALGDIALTCGYLYPHKADKIDQRIEEGIRMIQMRSASVAHPAPGM